MQDGFKKLKLIVDGAGSVEITGIRHGDTEAKKVARAVGLGNFYPLNIMSTAIRADGVPRAEAEQMESRAKELGLTVSEIDSLPPPPAARTGKEPAAAPAEHVSTVEILHRHSLAPSRREKAIIPFVVLAAAVLAVGVAMVIRDHMSHSYQRIPLAQLVRMEKTAPRAGGLASLLNPDDSGYVAFAVTSWGYWDGRSAMVDDFYVRIPELKEPSIERLVKAERGAASLVFRIDLSRSSGRRYHVDEIVRGGMPTENADLEMEIHPLRVENAPPVTAEGRDGTYRVGTEIRFDRDQSFKEVTRLAAQGWLARTPTGLVLDSEHYRVALRDDLEPGLAAVAEDLVGVAAEARAGGAGKAAVVTRGKVTLFVTIDEIFPWSVEGQPGRRQSTREIGLASVQGIQFGKVYVSNRAG